MEKLQKRKGTRGNKVKRLRKDDCRKWWGTVIRLTGSSGNTLSYSLECDREVLNEMALADILCFCGCHNTTSFPVDRLLLRLTILMKSARSS